MITFCKVTWDCHDRVTMFSDRVTMLELICCSQNKGSTGTQVGMLK